jgi:hypothetical protein
MSVARLDAVDVPALVQTKFENYDPNSKHGFAYRVPAPAIVSVKVGKTERAREPVSIAQLGVRATLPSSLGGFSTSYALKLDDVTGAIRSANFGSKAAVQKEMIDSAGANVNALLDARRAQLEARQTAAEEAAAAASPSAKLDAQKKLLETQVAVIEACRKLGLQCGLLVNEDGSPRKQQ